MVISHDGGCDLTLIESVTLTYTVKLLIEPPASPAVPGVYTALVLAATTNQRRPSLLMTFGNSNLSYGLYRSIHTDISPENFHP